MGNATLHYIYDPLCGWCYGAEPLINAATGVAGLNLALHGGGLWPEPTTLPRDMVDYIREADARVAKISGQPYGDAYRNELLPDPALVLESRPTTAAVLAAEAIDASKALQMLKGIQHAHYERGLHVVESEVLAMIAAEIGLDREEFDAALERVDVDAHIGATRQLMQQIGARGFPAFVLEVAGRAHAVPHQQFASDPAGFAAWLSQSLRRSA